MGHNVNSRREVDETMAQAMKAGATIIKAAHDTFCGGYAGYIQNPDGHLWISDNFVRANSMFSKTDRNSAFSSKNHLYHSPK